MSQLWTFQPNTYWHGWDETGLSINGGQTVRSIVREEIQNSLDAKADDAKRVKVKFELHSVQREMLPGADTVTEILGLCLGQRGRVWRFSSRGKRSLRILQKKKFPDLSCTDFGTTGMAGPYKKGKPFTPIWILKVRRPVTQNVLDRMVMAECTRSWILHWGQFSRVQHTLVNPVLEHLAQGKCVFMSHFQDEDQYENIGRWGHHDMTPSLNLMLNTIGLIGTRTNWVRLFQWWVHRQGQWLDDGNDWSCIDQLLPCLCEGF